MTSFKAQNIKNELQDFLNLLKNNHLLSLSSEEQSELQNKANELLKKFEILDQEVLTIGLLGGTGVGKSSLMNALAEKTISTASHRRPHTDKVLIYRHKDSPLPSSLEKTNVSWQEITHQAQAIRQILLCDLPDFDSLLGEHRDQVLDFLQHLDILVWVTSLEKYSDHRFYQFLQSVPKAQQNFYFVLNKIDLCFRLDSPEEGLSQLENIKKQFTDYIQKTLFSDQKKGELKVFAISASEAFQPEEISNWNQLNDFRELIFQHRQEKEIAKIKADNLDIEARNIFQKLQQEVYQINLCRQSLKDLDNEIEKERPRWLQSGKHLFQYWTNNHIFPHLVYEKADLSPLIGPGHLLGLIIQEFHHRKSNPNQGGKDVSYDRLPEGPAKSLFHHMENLKNRVLSKLLRSSVPVAMREEIQEKLDLDQYWKGLEKELTETIHTSLTEYRLPKYKLFRFKQGLVYSFLILLLIVALGGQKAWTNLLGQISFSHLVQCFFSIIHSLFSPVGLAAMASLAIILLFFGTRFYFDYEKMVRQRSEVYIQIISEQLNQVWLTTLDRFKENIQDLEDRLIERQEKLKSWQNKND